MRVAAVNGDAGTGVEWQLVGTQQVPAAHLGGIETELASPGVDGSLQGGVDLRLAGASVRPDRRCIRDSSAVAIPQTRYPVQAGALAVAGRSQTRRHVRVGPGIAPHHHVDARDAALRVEAHADAVTLAAPVRHRDELFLSALHPAHSTVQQLSSAGDNKELWHRVATAAEAAADRRLTHSNRRHGHLQEAAIQVRRAVDSLSGAPYVELAIRRRTVGQRRATDEIEWRRHDRTRLDRHRADPVVLAGELNDAVGTRARVVTRLSRRRRRIVEPRGCAQEAAAVDRVQRTHDVGARIGVEEDLVVGGSFDVDDSWQFVDIDGDQLGCVKRRCRRFGQHDRNRLADEAHPNVCKQRPGHLPAHRCGSVVLERGEAQRRGVEHRSHPGRPFGLPQIHVAQLAVGHRRTHERCMQAAVGRWHVGGERRCPTQHRFVF